MTDRLSNRRRALEVMLGGVGALTLAGCAGGRSSTPGTAGGTGIDAGSTAPLATAGPGRAIDQPAVPASHAGDLTDRNDRTARLLDEWNLRRSTRLPAHDTAMPGVISRRSWTLAGPILARANAMRGISRITIHHDGMNVFTSRAQRDAMRRIDAIRRSHVGQGWADIGYHFVIDPAGRVYEARPIALQGAHVKNNNPHNLGVMMLGNYMDQRPTREALATLDAFLAGAMRRYRVAVSRVMTHQELRATACPGTSLQQHMILARSARGALARA